MRYLLLVSCLMYVFSFVMAAPAQAKGGKGGGNGRGPSNFGGGHGRADHPDGHEFARDGQAHRSEQGEKLGNEGQHKHEKYGVTDPTVNSGGLTNPVLPGSLQPRPLPRTSPADVIRDLDGLNFIPIRP